MAPRVLVGTSGYSYDDWVGRFYPEGTARKDFLPLYAAEFPVVELNFSYYQQPSPRTLDRMLAATPPGFRFALKAHRSMTHEIGESWEKDIELFRTGIQPLVEAGRLAAVLLQFPYSFAYTAEARSRLSTLCGKLDGLPLAVEFRKSEWLREQVFEGLRERGVSLVSVDEPALPKLPPPTTETTGHFGYVRFHGRNKEAWGRETMQAATTTSTTTASSPSGFNASSSSWSAYRCFSCSSTTTGAGTRRRTRGKCASSSGRTGSCEPFARCRRR
jgi:uncharacterized protein YecE (DUF72 family)